MQASSLPRRAGILPTGCDNQAGCLFYKTARMAVSRSGGLDMHEHIRDPRISSPDRVFHLVRDGMAGADGDRLIHANVQIDVELQPHLSHQTFVDVEHAWN